MNILDYLYENKRTNIVIIAYDHAHYKTLRNYIFQKGQRRFSRHVEWRLETVTKIRCNFRFPGDESYIHFVPLMKYLGVNFRGMTINVLLIAEEISEDELIKYQVMEELSGNIPPDGIVAKFSRRNDDE